MKSEILHLDQLIQRLQVEGVDRAESMAADILKQAEERARRIVAEAEEKAAEILNQSREDLQSREQALKDRLKTQGRDLLLLSRQRLQEAFADFVAQSLNKEIQPKFLAQCLEQLAQGIDPDQPVSLILPEETKADLAQELANRFGQALGKEVEVGRKKGLEQGFWVRLEEEERYFDFSLAHLSEIFMQLMSGNLKEIFKGFDFEEEL